MKHLILILIIFSSFSFIACKETKTVLIKSTLIDCEGVSAQKCLQYQIKGEDTWQLFYDNIEGFEYEEGFNYELVVAIEKINNPPADGSDLKYTLKKMVKKEKDLAMVMENTNNSKLEFTQEKETPLVVYDSHTRGYHYTLTIYETYLTEIKVLNGKPIKGIVNSQEITAIKKIIAEINLKEIEQFKDPTQKRFYDGAPHTTITIVEKGESFKSKTFDGGFPPEELKVLVNKVLSLAPEK